MIAEVAPARLRDTALLENLPEDALIDLAKHCRYMELPAGETLFHQGDPGDSLYVLVDGQIHIVRVYPSGEEIILATHGPYYAIGELSMVADQPRTGSVVAVSDCTLISLEREAFVQTCNRVPEMMSSILSHLGLRLYEMNLLVREHALKNVESRIASLLMLLARDTPRVDDLRVPRIARATATDADTVTLFFRKWTKLGYIALEGQSLILKDMDAIRELAG
ncbi:MAG: Crp/Fnr family transcriptional regulator [Aggregatilineales bacterium]